MKKSLFVVLPLLLSACDLGSKNTGPHYDQFFSEFIQSIPYLAYETANYDLGIKGWHSKVPYAYHDAGVINGEYFSKEVGFFECDKYVIPFFTGNDETLFFNFDLYKDYLNPENDYFSYSGDYSKSERENKDESTLEFSLVNGNYVANYEKYLGTQHGFEDWLKEDFFQSGLHPILTSYEGLTEESKKEVKRIYELRNNQVDKYYIKQLIDDGPFVFEGSDGQENFRIYTKTAKIPLDIPVVSKDVMLVIVITYGDYFLRTFLPFFDEPDFYVYRDGDETNTYNDSFKKSLGLENVVIDSNIVGEEETKTYISNYYSSINNGTIPLGPSNFVVDMHYISKFFEDIGSAYFIDSVVTAKTIIANGNASQTIKVESNGKTETSILSVTYSDGKYIVVDSLEGSLNENKEDHNNITEYESYSDVQPIFYGLRMAGYTWGIDCLYPFLVNDPDKFNMTDAYSITDEKGEVFKEIFYTGYDYMNQMEINGHVTFNGGFIRKATIYSGETCIAEFKLN